MIKAGDRIPSATLREVKESGPRETTTDAFFKGRKMALFAVPGAFTSTCSVKHLPSFANNADALRGKGVEAIACVATNDASVMKAWGEHSGTVGKGTMLSDGNGDFARAVGLDKNLTAAGMGTRSSRYSMIVEDGVVKALNVEDKPGVNVSGASTVLGEIDEVCGLEPSASGPATILKQI